MILKTSSLSLVPTARSADAVSQAGWRAELHGTRSGFREPRRIRLVLPAILLALLAGEVQWLSASDSAPASAVAPANLATEDSVFGSGTFSGVLRIQLAYGPQHFSDSGLLITQLRFRPDSSYGQAFTSTVSQIEIRLSTTSRDPDQLSRTFAENIGPDETVVFDGPLALSSAFAGPPNGPKEFDMIVPLNQPFVYGPALGSLLVDIRNFSGSGASALSGQSRPDDAASRVFGGIAAASGNVDRGVDALQVIYTPTNGPPPPPPRLTRGPYLQSGTTSNIVVRWRTSRAADSQVHFGLSAGDLSWKVSDATPKTDHIVTLTNLAPDTKYFYAVGTGETNFAGGADYHFLTAPTQTRPVRIWALGDFGTVGTTYGLPENARGVRDAYYAFAGSRYTDVWITMGDNSQGGGTDAEYQMQVFDIYPEMLRRTVMWPGIGNHDAAYFPTRFDFTNVFTTPTRGEAGGLPSYSQFYYSFDYANIHFVCLDSITQAPRTNDAMFLWLDQDLAVNTKDWTIAYWHSPPYTFGSHNSDSVTDTWGTMVDMRERILPLIEAHGVDLVLCGHSHVYERSYLLDGHYGYSSSFLPEMIKDSGSGQPGDTGAYLKAGLGPNPHQGTVYVVNAVGGWNTPLIWGLPERHPVMTGRIRQRGSMIIDVNSNRLDAIFLTDTGARADQFTIIKGAAPELLRVVTYRMSNGQVRMQWKSVAGGMYRVEGSTAFDAANWVAVSGDILATGATTGWTNVVPADVPIGFYRIRRIE